MSRRRCSAISPNAASTRITEQADRDREVRSDEDLREAALRHLADTPGEARTTLLIEIFDGSTSVDTKETIIRHLGERGDAKAAAKLLAIAKGDADSDLREAAIRQIAR